MSFFAKVKLLLLPSHFSHVRLCVTPQTTAHQAPPSLGFSRQDLLLFNHKKNEIMPLAAAWVDLEMIILSEESQKEKDRYNKISLLCGI